VLWAEKVDDDFWYKGDSVLLLMPLMIALALSKGVLLIFINDDKFSGIEWVPGKFKSTISNKLFLSNEEDDYSEIIY